MFPSLRITTFGWLISFGLLLAVGTTVLLSSVSFRNAQNVEEIWTQFDNHSAKKVLLLGEIRGLLGYDGMIHHFKNYILRQERWRVIAVYQKMLQLSIAMTAYESLSLDPQEQKAFNVLNDTVDNYMQKIAIAEAMSDAHKSSLEIDSVVQVDDTSAIMALAILEGRLAKHHRQKTLQVQGSVQRIISFSKASGLILVVLLLSLASLIIWFTHWRIMRPLNGLVEAFGTIDPTDPGGNRLPTEGSIRTTELDMLAQSGNSFIDAVHEHSVLRQNAQDNLRDREENLRAVVENAVDPIITINDQGLILSFNTAAIIVFGYEVHEVLDQNISILMPEPDKSAHDTYIRNYLVTGAVKVLGRGREVIGRRKDGSEFPLRIGISEIVTPRGVSFTAIVRDLTQEKENEHKMVLAKEEAENANMAKSQFLASMSHELRTPMNAILGFSELMKTNPNDPPSKSQDEYLHLVMNSGHQLMGLIDQVLDLSQIETGEIVVHMTEVSVFPIVAECLLNFSTKAEALDVKLENKCLTGEGYIVYSDPVRLRQILLNFISNAIKYNKPKGQVSVVCSVKADHITRISVQDTGQGIAPAAQDHIFMPFNRLGREAGQIDGTGIGLTITEKLANAIGATVNFQSKEGQGSVFWVDIPHFIPSKPHTP